MEALIISTLAVTVAEIGDKTQLLTLFLITRFKRPWPIIMGILAATLVNHGLSAWFGDWLAGLVDGSALDWILGISFLLMAGWLLIPDKDDSADSRFLGLGAFGATLVLFFLAEIGDKTQVATVLLAARFDELWAVIIGTTLGMLAANLPVIWGGQWLLQRLPMRWVHLAAAALFVIMAAFAFWRAF